MNNRINHLMIDGYEGSERLMEDPSRVRMVANEISRLVATLTQEPYVIPYFDGEVPEDCGVTATGTFEEGGHTAIHTFSRRGIVFVDIASSTEITQAVQDEVHRKIIEAFDLKRHDSFDRGAENLETLPPCFGPHIMIDGQLNKPFGIGELYDFIDELPTVIGMNSIAKPHVIKRKNGGLTGLGIIAESHIALHQKPNAEFSFDIFSCKPFNISKLNGSFDLRGIPRGQSTLIARGLDFPR